MFAKAERETSSLRQAEEGLHLRIKLSDGANNGCDFDVFAVVNNNTDTERLCHLTLGARTASYNGTLGPQCGMKDLPDLTLQPWAGKGPAGTAGLTLCPPAAPPPPESPPFPLPLEPPPRSAVTSKPQPGAAQ